MDKITETITATVKDPTTGESFTFVGDTQESVDKQIDEFFSEPTN